MWMPRIAQPLAARSTRLQPDGGSTGADGEAPRGQAVTKAESGPNGGGTAKRPAQNLEEMRRALRAGQRVRLDISL